MLYDLDAAVEGSHSTGNGCVSFAKVEIDSTTLNSRRLHPADKV